jgi:uncharacterized sodium:solute symporter family permease YidK
MILTRFVKKAFRVVFEIFLWILFLGPAIVGIAMTGGTRSGGEGAGAGGSFLSVLPLLLGGFLLAVLLGGLVSTFLDMAKNIEQLVDKKKSTSAE